MVKSSKVLKGHTEKTKLLSHLSLFPDAATATSFLSIFPKIVYAPRTIFSIENVSVYIRN